MEHANIADSGAGILATVQYSRGKNGTEIRLQWPVSACSILVDAKERFLQIGACPGPAGRASIVISGSGGLRVPGDPPSRMPPPGGRGIEQEVGARQGQRTDRGLVEKAPQVSRGTKTREAEMRPVGRRSPALTRRERPAQHALGIKHCLPTNFACGNRRIDGSVNPLLYVFHGWFYTPDGQPNYSLGGGAETNIF